jgi:hypothetical protein
MSVFQDEADDDGQQYAHLQAQASSLAAPSSSLGGSAGTSVAAAAAPIVSGNPVSYEENKPNQHYTAIDSSSAAIGALSIQLLHATLNRMCWTSAHCRYSPHCVCVAS